MPDFRLPKKEKLTHKRLWESLFKSGKRLKAYPLLLYFDEASLPEAVRIQVGFSVPKRRFAKAVDRNRIRRLMREAYRLEKSTAFNSTKRDYAFVILYLGNHTPTFQEIQRATGELIRKFAEYEENAED